MTSKESSRLLAITIILVLLIFYLYGLFAFALSSIFCFDSGTSSAAWRCFGLAIGGALFPMLFLVGGIILLFYQRWWFAVAVAAIPALLWGATLYIA
jgi:hypothetical protein